jgi:protein transport protein SEC23
MALVQYQAIACPKCNTILNPYCAIDFRFKTWMCSTCQNKNAFPAHYANNITETQLPAELIQDFTTIEYILPNTTQGPSKPIFLIMVDTAVCSEELAELKDSL